MRVNNRGAVLIETLVVLPLIAIIAFRLHAVAVREGNAKLETLQKKRLRYDGERSWNP